MATRSADKGPAAEPVADGSLGRSEVVRELLLDGSEDDAALRVQVVQQRSGTFSGFDGYKGDQATDVENEHDAWGVE